MKSQPDSLYENYQSGFRDRPKQFAIRPIDRYFHEVFLPKFKGAKIIDLGCGHGTLVQYLRKLGYNQAIGVDHSGSQVSAIPHEAVLQCDVFAFLEQTEDSSVDAFCCIDLLEHLTRDQLIEIARRIARCLKPGGIWLIHVPNGGALFGGRIRYGDLTHETAFTVESLNQLAKHSKLRLHSIKEDRPIVHGLTSLVRRCAYEVIRMLPLMWLAIETGSVQGAVLSMNFSAVFVAPER
jgi:SAM-dependent methyltransferase